MTQNAPRESAKIYQFPVGGRAALSIRNADGKAAHNGLAATEPGVDFGGWYHDEAIVEAATPGKR